MTLTRSQEIAIASALVLVLGLVGGSELKTLEAIEAATKAEAVESEFYETVYAGESLLAEAEESYQEAYSWESPTTEDRRMESSFSSRSK